MTLVCESSSHYQEKQLALTGLLHNIDLYVLSTDAQIHVQRGYDASNRQQNETDRYLD